VYWHFPYIVWYCSFCAGVCAYLQNCPFSVRHYLQICRTASFYTERVRLLTVSPRTSFTWRYSSLGSCAVSPHPFFECQKEVSPWNQFLVTSDSCWQLLNMKTNRCSVLPHDGTPSSVVVVIIKRLWVLLWLVWLQLRFLLRVSGPPVVKELC
jgi:hypothetical protein